MGAFLYGDSLPKEEAKKATNTFKSVNCME
jgi:hypothetical protein